MPAAITIRAQRALIEVTIGAFGGPNRGYSVIDFTSLISTGLLFTMGETPLRTKSFGGPNDWLRRDYFSNYF